MDEFDFAEILPLTHGIDEAQQASAEPTQYRQVLDADSAGLNSFEAQGRSFLEVPSAALRTLTAEAMRDIAHLLRPKHLSQLASILDDDEASPNDRFVALELLKNANIAAGGVLPGCQDTGTAIIWGHKGAHILTDGNDHEAISRGVFDTYTTSNLRYSQLSPLSMFEEANTANNLPAQIEIYAEPDPAHAETYELVFMAKGGGSANKSFLFQKTKALLNPDSLIEFLDAELRKIGTSACPPYHLGVVIGGTSAEYALKTAKYASAKYLDSLPTQGSKSGSGYRDLDWEQRILELTRTFGIGAQFGGKYFCHDVRVVRLPRHGASCPVGIAVSCSADRQALAKITSEGVFLEQLETDPAKYLPETEPEDLSGDVISVDLSRPMDEVRQELTKYPVKTRLSLSGTLVVARDVAHAKIKERLDAGEEMPAYLRDMPVYYAGPAKTPKGLASGSFGPTTAGRMDPYVEQFQAAGGSLVMLAKGNRSRHVVEACAKYGGFHLGSIGGPAALLAQKSIRHVEVLEYPELGMEAVWKIEIEDFPAFVVIDDKGNDFFSEVLTPVAVR